MIRRYFVDACHPVWGLDLVFCYWRLLGQRLLVGMGSGRKRLNILGAYCLDHEYIDFRLTRDNINGEQFVNFLRLLLSMHPETERFILYVDGPATSTARWSRIGFRGTRSSQPVEAGKRGAGRP